MKDKFLGSLIGLAVGDCVGVPAEFKRPGTFELIHDMVGGGVFGLKVGEWTDDTSMALCLADSIIENHGFNADDQMQRYVRWKDKGYLSSIDRCFDIGIGTTIALENYKKSGEPFSGSKDSNNAGNGSIMRLAPAPLYWSNDMEQAIYFSGESSKTTHQAEETVDACYYLGALIAGAVNGISKENLLSQNFVRFVESKLGRPLSPKIKHVAEGSYKNKEPRELEASGYVVHSLEAALWGFYLADHFKEGLLLVVNLGNDADSTGAIYGQLAGAYYGLSGIPQEWVQRLVKLELITNFATRLYDLQVREFADIGNTCEYNVFFNEQN